MDILFGGLGGGTTARDLRRKRSSTSHQVMDSSVSLSEAPREDKALEHPHGVPPALHISQIERRTSGKYNEPFNKSHSGFQEARSLSPEPFRRHSAPHNLRSSSSSASSRAQGPEAAGQSAQQGASRVGDGAFTVSMHGANNGTLATFALIVVDDGSGHLAEVGAVHFDALSTELPGKWSRSLLACVR